MGSFSFLRKGHHHVPRLPRRRLCRHLFWPRFRCCTTVTMNLDYQLPPRPPPRHLVVVVDNLLNPPLPRPLQPEGVRKPLWTTFSSTSARVCTSSLSSSSPCYLMDLDLTVCETWPHHYRRGELQVTCQRSQTGRESGGRRRLTDENCRTEISTNFYLLSTCAIVEQCRMLKVKGEGRGRSKNEN